MTGTLTKHAGGYLLKFVMRREALHELAACECRNLNNYFTTHIEEGLASLVYGPQEAVRAGKQLAVKPRRLELREARGEAS